MSCSLPIPPEGDRSRAHFPGAVTDNNVARFNANAVDDNRLIDRLDLQPHTTRSWHHVPREYRKVEFHDLLEIPHGSVDHQARNALELCSEGCHAAPGGTESPVTIDDDHVTGFCGINYFTNSEVLGAKTAKLTT